MGKSIVDLIDENAELIVFDDATYDMCSMVTGKKLEADFLEEYKNIFPEYEYSLGWWCVGTMVYERPKFVLFKKDIYDLNRIDLKMIFHLSKHYTCELVSVDENNLYVRNLKYKEDDHHYYVLHYTTKIYPIDMDVAEGWITHLQGKKKDMQSEEIKSKIGQIDIGFLKQKAYELLSLYFYEDRLPVKAKADLDIVGEDNYGRPVYYEVKSHSKQEVRVQKFEYEGAVRIFKESEAMVAKCVISDNGIWKEIDFRKYSGKYVSENEETPGWIFDVGKFTKWII